MDKTNSISKSMEQKQKYAEYIHVFYGRPFNTPAVKLKEVSQYALVVKN